MAMPWVWFISDLSIAFKYLGRRTMALIRSFTGGLLLLPIPPFGASIWRNGQWSFNDAFKIHDRAWFSFFGLRRKKHFCQVAAAAGNDIGISIDKVSKKFCLHHPSFDKRSSVCLTTRRSQRLYLRTLYTNIKMYSRFNCREQRTYYKSLFLSRKYSPLQGLW